MFFIFYIAVFFFLNSFLFQLKLYLQINSHISFTKLRLLCFFFRLHFAIRIFCHLSVIYGAIFRNRRFLQISVIEFISGFFLLSLSFLNCCHHFADQFRSFFFLPKKFCLFFRLLALLNNDLPPKMTTKWVFFGIDGK